MKFDLSRKYIWIVVAITIATVVLGVSYGWGFLYADVVYPNTTLVGVEIGGMEIDEAMEKIAKNLDEFVDKPIVLINGEEVHEFTAEELGLAYDLDEIKKEIPTFGDHKGLINIVLRSLIPQIVQIPIGVDEQMFIGAVSIIHTESLPQNAYLYLDTESGDIKTKLEQNGQQLSQEGLLELLKWKFTYLDEEALTLPIDTLYPEVVSGDLEPFVVAAQEVFNRSLQIYYEDEIWEFYPNDFAHLITFKTENTVSIEGVEDDLAIALDPIEDPEEIKSNELISTNLSLEIEENGISEYVETNLKEYIESTSEDVVIAMDEEGEISFEGSAVDGVEINETGLKSAIELALETGVNSIEVPTTIIKGGVESPEELQELGVIELIATGYTNFYGSPYNRRMNIAVGMEKFDGLLIAPGETFSFLDNLGVVDGSTGYYRELVITDNETRPEYGGGLCQVSSTLFRAILYGGFPIVTRYEHSYAVSYYAYPDGYGLDATIYQPWPDLQFTNDTENYILIQAYTIDNDAYFKFYGTSDSRVVEMDGPYYSNYVSPPEDVIIYTTELEPGVTQQEDSAHTGFDVDWYRTIIYADGTTSEENIHSHYQAWAAKYLVGISEEEYAATEEDSTELTTE